MASGPLHYDMDIEAQNLDPQPPEVGTSKMHGMSVYQPQAKSDPDSRAGLAALSVPADQSGTSNSRDPALLELDDWFEKMTPRGSKSQKGDVHRFEPQTERSAVFGHETTQKETQADQADMEAPLAYGMKVDLRDVNDTLVNDGPISGTTDREPQEIEEKRMIGDFDGSSNPLWTLFGKEAKSHDQSRIQTLKDDMDGVLIFAGLFSAVLTAFIIDIKQRLKASPADQTVYYLQQNVAMLSQISKQISFVVPQVTIPSTPPPPFPTFNPTASDVRINAFWFMALIFSLFAALLATLVQQWVRDYMCVFQRHSDPLKSARIRQYLYEGCEGWYMPVVAETVPGLLHVSLFLFFVGLGDFVLNTNTAISLSTIIPIGTCGLLYIFTTFAPVIYPQSPYQNSFSGLIWYLVQKLFHGRRYKDRRSDGMLKLASSNMVEGQMQLAMEETEERMGRDARSIRWLIDSLTEDSEMELLAMTIPGSFNPGWGMRVWKKVSDIRENGHMHEGPPALGTSSTNDIMMHSLRTLHPPDSSAPGHSAIASVQGDTVVRELSERMAYLLESCKNRGSFASDELWRRRTRACVETTASLVFCANAELEWFGDIGQLLRDIGMVEKAQELSLTGMDLSFVTRWTCLSITTIRLKLKSNVQVQQAAAMAVEKLADMPPHSVDIDDNIISVANCLDNFLFKGWKCMVMICAVLFSHRNTNTSIERVKQVLQLEQSQMNELEDFFLNAPTITAFDTYISVPQHSIQVATQGLICEVPGVELDGDRPDPFPFSMAVELMSNISQQFFLPARCGVGLSSIYPKFRDILEGRDPEPWEFQELLKDLRSFDLHDAVYRGSFSWRQQLWRLQDLCFAGGFGFTIELFFIALKQLLSTSSSKDSRSELYVGTFRAITSDWRAHSDSIGTQQVLLNLVAYGGGLLWKFNYPAYITEELLVLVNNMFKGKTGPHIDDAIKRLSEEGQDEDPRFYFGPPGFPARVLKLLSSSQPPASPSS